MRRKAEKCSCDCSRGGEQAAAASEELEPVGFADLMIRTKEKQLRPFEPNEVQTRYLDLLAEKYAEFDWRRGVFTLRNVREDVLKARQQGMSTLWLALFFLDTINNPLTQSLILTDNGSRSETLFKIIHRFYEHLPAAKRRPTRYSNKREIEFSDNDSIIAVGTAGTSAVGRGGTVNNALLSERAFWCDGAEVEIGLLESIPIGGNVVRESTANGLGDYYEERQRAHHNESDFTARFFGWNLHFEYRLPVPESFQPTDEEIRLANEYGLEKDQLVWRRAKIKTLREKFVQEYPLNEQEAFISSGQGYFDRAALIERNDELQKAAFDPIGNLLFDREKFPLLRNAYADGSLAVWELADSGHDYIVSADPAGGIDTDGKRDYCSADVLDASTWTQTAHLHGRWEPHAFGMMLAELGRMYDDALVGVHQLNHGHAVIDALIYAAKYPLQRGNGASGIYFFDESQISGKRASTDSKARRAGWPENSRTKPWMLDKLGESLVMSPGLNLRSRKTVSELLTFVELPGGRSGAEGRAHDDCVSSLALGVGLLNIRFARRSGHTDLTPREPVAPGGTRRKH